MPVIEHRNIVFFLFDSLNCSDLERMLHAGDLPALSQLYKNGVLFSRCYTPCPESSPARASLFTGLDPSVHGLWTNGVALPDTERTLSHLLKSAGYSTYLAGRYQLAGVSRWTTEQARLGDFDHIDWAHGPLHRSRQNMYLQWLEQAAPDQYARLFPTQANPDNTAVSQGQRLAIESLPDELSFNHWVGERVGDWIKNTSVKKPFFAMASFCVGNGSGAEPQVSGDGEELVHAALQHADTAIGRVVAQLREGNRAEDTIIVVASARGNCKSAGSEMTERSIKVPLLICQPGVDQHIVDATVSTIDIAPTILKLVNVAHGLRMHGSILPVVCGESEPSRGWGITRLRSRTLAGVHNRQTSFCSGNLKLVVNHDDADQDKISLFNLDTDPDEQINLALDAACETDLEKMIDQMIDARCALEDRTEPRIAEF